MPVGSITLVLLLLLAGFGFLDGPLSRMGLTVRQALAAILAMLLGSPFTVSLAPDLQLNIGTAVVPVVAALGLVARSPTGEGPRAVWSAAAVAAAVYLVGCWFPPGRPTELNFYNLDAQYLFAVVAALVACGTGRTLRGTFAAAVLGVMLADGAHFVARRWGIGDAGAIQIGGGAFWGTGVVAGALAVLLAHLVGQGGELFRPPSAQRRAGPFS